MHFLRSPPALSTCRPAPPPRHMLPSTAWVGVFQGPQGVGGSWREKLGRLCPPVSLPPSEPCLLEHLLLPEGLRRCGCARPQGEPSCRGCSYFTPVVVEVRREEEDAAGGYSSLAGMPLRPLPVFPGPASGRSLKPADLSPVISRLSKRAGYD